MLLHTSFCRGCHQMTTHEDDRCMPCFNARVQAEAEARVEAAKAENLRWSFLTEREKIEDLNQRLRNLETRPVPEQSKGIFDL